MRILIVAMPASVHAAKWLLSMRREGDSVFLFPSNGSEPHESIDQGKVRLIRPHPFLWRLCTPLGRRWYDKAVVLLRIIHKAVGFPDQARRLARCIRRIKPDLVHSMETQHSGYLVLEARERHFPDKAFPSWLHTNWGSDIFLFGRLAEHRDRIERIMRQCDYYSCESRRDIDLARAFGFCGHAFDPFPNACGIDIPFAEARRGGIRPSARKTILVKGYQNWAGRALVALRAIALSADRLAACKIIVYSAEGCEDVRIAAELLRQESGLDLEILGERVSNERMLLLFSEARLYIGLSISDGISTSLLEAMAMGAFPIQSGTSTASEWIVDGEGGFIVPPEDPQAVADRIIEAMTDGDLVDRAAAINWKTIKERADSEQIRESISGIYLKIERDLGERERGLRR
jgi:glycosyltransferase involved in cell wall biosynthesis